LRKHTSMIVLRNGDIGEVPAKLLERCPTCQGVATVVPNRNRFRQLFLIAPANVLGIVAAWAIHRPEPGDSSSYMVFGAISLICAASAYVPILLLFGRGKDTLNFRHCPKCMQDWDLEENLVNTDKG